MGGMLKSLLIFTSIFVTSSAFSLDISSTKETQSVKVVTARVSPVDVQPGSRISVSIDVSISQGFSVYEDKIKLFPLEPDGMRLEGLKMSPVVEFIDFSGKPHRGLQNKASLDFFAEIPKDASQPLKTLALDLEYIACTTKYCSPPTRLEVKLPLNIESRGVAPNSSMIEQQISQNLLWAFMLVFVFGFLTSLTPCVYPLIPITLAVIGARASQLSKVQAFSLSLVYVLGISATYSLLGVIAAKTGALFGQALSYQPVVLAFVILFVLMALSIYGYFEIRIPHFVSKRLEKSGKKNSGYLGAFSSGLIAGIVASPCVGPVLVGVLAYIAKTQDVVLGFSLLFTFAMGMGLLFLFLGTFSAFFKKLPRSGGWMDVVKFVLGTTMLGVALYYLKPLLPDTWFLICLSLMGTAAVFIFLAKVYPKFDHKFFHQMPFVFCALMVLSPIASKIPATPTQEQMQKAALQNGWTYYSEDALQKAKEEGKPVIIDFFADWCAACVELDEKTFSTPEFIEATKNFMLLKVDASENFPELADLQKKYEVYGLPTIVFIDKSGNVVKDITLTGFEDLQQMMLRIQKLK
jgi:thioredoxin:protein disulfide reductase